MHVCVCIDRLYCRTVLAACESMEVVDIRLRRKLVRSELSSCENERRWDTLSIVYKRELPSGGVARQRYCVFV